MTRLRVESFGFDISAVSYSEQSEHLVGIQTTGSRRIRADARGVPTREALPRTY